MGIQAMLILSHDHRVACKRQYPSGNQREIYDKIISSGRNSIPFISSISPVAIVKVRKYLTAIMAGYLLFTIKAKTHCIDI